MKHPIVFIIAAAMILSSLPVFSQESPDDSEKLFTEGVKYFKKGQYEEALDMFLETYRMTPHWKLKYNIAMCYYEMKDEIKAAGELSEFLEEGGEDIPEKQKKLSDKTLGELKKKLGIARIIGDVAGMVVTIDGSPVEGVESGKDIFLAPGSHLVEISFDQNVVLDEEITLDPGGSVELRPEKKAPVVEPEVVEPEEEPAAPEPAVQAVADEKEPAGTGKKRMAAWGVLAGALASLAAGGVMGGMAMKEKGDMTDARDEYLDIYRTNFAEAERLKEEGDDHYDKAKGYALAADVLFPLGGALAVTSIILFVVSRKEKKKKIGPASGAGVFWTGNALAVEFSF